MSERPSAPARLAGRIGRHSALYISTSGVAVVAGIANLAIVTRYLPPSEFGTLALLLFFHSLAVIVINAGSLQGTFAWVFGAAGGDEGDLPEEDVEGARATDRRRAYMTGIVLTAAVGALCVALVAPVAGPVAEWLLDDSGDSDLVLLATVAAGAHALWRLTVNCLRLARRPAAYFASTVWLNAATIAASVVLLEAGLGVEGVVTAYVIANGAAVALNLLLARRDVRLAVSLGDARQIMRRGRALLPVIVSFTTMQLADVFLLSRSVSVADVGVYRVASRIGSLTSQWTSGFNMASGALRRDPLHHAVDAAQGAARTASTLVTWFTILTFWVILGTGLFAEQLARIAAGEYDEAAALIPLCAIGFGCHGWYVLIYRTSRFREKRRWFIALSVVAALTFVGLALVLIPWLGLYGAPAAIIAGWTVGIVGMWIRSRRSEDQVPYEYGRMLAALAIAGACYAAGRLLAPDGDWRARTLVEVGAFLLYPALVLATGVAPRGHLRAAAGAMRSGVPARGRADVLRARLAGLDAADRRLLHACAVQRRDPAVVAELVDVPADDVRRRAVAALRQVGEIGEPGEVDERLGAYLFDQAAFADRDHLAADLWREGADPLEADELRSLADELRRRARSVWHEDDYSSRALRSAPAPRTLRRPWLAGLLVALLCTGAGVAVGLLREPIWNADSEVATLELRELRSSENRVVGITLARAYARFVDTGLLNREIADAAGIPVREVRERLSATAIDGQPIVRLESEGDSEQATADLARVAPLQLVAEIRRRARPDDAGARLLGRYRAAVAEAVRLERRATALERQAAAPATPPATATIPPATPPRPTAAQISEVRADAHAARLRAATVARLFQDRRTDESLNRNPEIIDPGTTATSDREEVLLILAGGGLVVGGVLGVLVTVLVGRRRRNPASR